MRKLMKKLRMSDEMSLQITSMADIFTIILVFLLKSSATSAVDITPPNGMKIPEGVSLQAPEESLKIQISQDSVQVENLPVVSLSDFRFQAGEVGQNFTSASVNAALEKEEKTSEAYCGGQFGCTYQFESPDCC